MAQLKEIVGGIITLLLGIAMVACVAIAFPVVMLMFFCLMMFATIWDEIYFSFRYNNKYIWLYGMTENDWTGSYEVKKGVINKLAPWKELMELRPDMRERAGRDLTNLLKAGLVEEKSGTLDWEIRLDGGEYRLTAAGAKKKAELNLRFEKGGIASWVGAQLNKNLEPNPY